MAMVGKFTGDQMDDTALAFEHAMHGKQLRPQQRTPLPLGDVTPDNDIDDAGFVFQCDEDDAARRVRALSPDHDSCSTSALAMRQLLQLRSGNGA